MSSDTRVFSPGMRVLCRDAEWLVTRVETADTERRHFAVHCVGADDLVRGHEAVFLTQLDRLEPVDPSKTELVEDGSAGFRMARLFLEAQLRQMPATGLAPDLDGLGVFEPMRFQERAVELALNQLRPRLLLADAVGLGKTIEVGMILTELMRRGRAKRILVLVRKSMLTQFQSELWNRFSIPLVRLDSTGLARLRLRIPASKNPFEVYHRVIISIDTLKNVGRYRHFLENTRWDAVVIDEAHNVAGASVPERHLAHRLARLLSRRTDSLLLTTATPHNGKRETFGRLISLLDPSTIPDPEMRDYTADDIKGFFVMRFKEDIREEAGDNFADRHLVPLARTTTEATPAEESVYETLADLREATARAAKAGEPWARHSLVQWGLYKLFLSSPEACLATTGKRLARLRMENPESPEIGYLEQLENGLRQLDLRKTARYAILRQQLRDIGWDGSKKSPRILIFTESRPTQDALAAFIAEDFKLKYSTRQEDQPAQAVALIHGGQSDVNLMKTVEAFATGNAPIRLLIATDVASEGINLHHQCHHIIHWDLPWSIITLIQRNGRIDRFGQKHSPELRYLMVETRQGLLKGDSEIFGRLVDKVEEINRSTRQGETVLKLYDTEAEERYVAEHGLIAGDAGVLEKRVEEAAPETGELEATIDAGNLRADDDFLNFLLGGTQAGDESRDEKPDLLPAGRTRLLSDSEFLFEGYGHLRSLDQTYQPIESNGSMMTLTAPADLRRRLGAPDERGDVVFGATAIPSEAWPEHGQFRLTADPERVELAIQAARNTAGFWASESLCTEQHPILQWIGERLLMLVGRGQAPIITSRDLAPRELCFVFAGQVSSRAGSPLVVNAHAVAFTPGGQDPGRIFDIHEAMNRIGFDRLVNTGAAPDIAAARTLVPAAVAISIKHLQALETLRVKQVKMPLRREERRLRKWAGRRREILEERISELGSKHPKARKAVKQIREMEDYLSDRELNWRENFMHAAPEPTTRLVLVVEGVQ